MFLKISFYVLSIILISSIVSSSTQEPNIHLVMWVIDYRNSANISQSRVQVTIRPPSENVLYQTDHYEYIRNLDPKQLKFETIKIEVANQNYLDYLIKVKKLLKDKDKLVRELKVYLVSDTQEVPHSFLLREKTRYLDNLSNIHRVYAIFKYANDNKLIEETDEYGIMVRYNYARSLLEMCKEGYETCNLAKNQCQNLKADYDNNKNSFKGISVSNLDNCIKISDDFIKLEQWKSVEIAFEESGTGYRNAAEQIEEIIGEYDEEEYKQFWETNNKPKFVLLRDQGISYLKYSDYLIANPGETDAKNIVEYLDASIASLSKAIELGDNSPEAYENLELAKLKRASLP